MDQPGQPNMILVLELAKRTVMKGSEKIMVWFGEQIRTISSPVFDW
jgi:hypothetical protein